MDRLFGKGRSISPDTIVQRTGKVSSPSRRLPNNVDATLPSFTNQRFEGETRKRRIIDADPAETSPKRKKGKVVRKECTVCCTEVAINRFPKLPHKGAGLHDRSVCFNCWEQHLATEIDSKGWDSISCPECEQRLDGSEIKKLASDESCNL